MASSAALGHQLSGARVCRPSGARAVRARAPAAPARTRTPLRVRAHGPGGGQHLTPEVRARSPPSPRRRSRHVAYNAPVAERDGKD